MFKIVLVTDINRLPSKTKALAERVLGELSYSGAAVVTRIPRTTIDIGPIPFDGCDAVITRPTDDLRLTPEHFAGANKQLVRIFCPSVGTGHVKPFKKKRRFEIVSSVRPLTNARGVAAFNILLASALFAEFPINTSNVRSKRFNGTPEQTNLLGKTWLMLGAGDQAGRILELAALSGVRKFYLWNDVMDEDVFEKATARLESAKVGRILRDKAHLRMRVLLSSADGPRSFVVEGIRNLRPYCAEADIVSLHMPYQEKDDDRHKRNAGFIKPSFLRLLRKRPILINTARGELLNERAVLRALAEHRLRGVAVDVLNEDVERMSDVDSSPLWKALSGDSESLNFAVTPHIAGSVDNDVYPMWDAMLTKLVSTVQSPRDRRQ